MTLSRPLDHAALIAEPLAENSWRVCNTAELDVVSSTMGFIGELGGTYEVRVLNAPELHRFVPTFKEAMEYLEKVAS